MGHSLLPMASEGKNTYEFKAMIDIEIFTNKSTEDFDIISNFEACCVAVK